MPRIPDQPVTQSPEMTDEHESGWSKVRAIDAEVAHLWMVRTFLKHADEAEEDEDLRDVVRDLYDFILAVGPINEVDDPAGYLKMAKKKLSKLRKATELYEEIQPEVSGHTNFVMAARSLRLCVDAIAALIASPNENRNP